jgi:hypothetical protein
MNLAEGTKKRNQSLVEQLWRFGLVVFLLFVLAVWFQLCLIYWFVPFRTSFEAPAEFIFETKGSSTEQDSVLIAQASALVPSILLRRLWSRRQGAGTMEHADPTDCFSLDTATFRRNCEYSGTIDVELHWTLPASPRNEQVGTITVELSLWQIPHPRSRQQLAPTQTMLCERRRSVRVLAYRSSTEHVLRSVLSFPKHLFGALDVWRWSQRPARMASRNAEQRCLQLLRCAPLYMLQEQMNQKVTMNATGHSGPHIPLLTPSLAVITRTIRMLWKVLGRQCLWDGLLGAVVALIPLGIGEWLNDRYILSDPPYLLEVRLRLYQFGTLQAQKTPGQVMPTIIELEGGSASIRFEWVLVGWRRFLRRHYVIGSILGSWAIFLLLLCLYALYRMWPRGANLRPQRAAASAARALASEGYNSSLS